MPTLTTIPGSCASCGSALELECEGLQGFYGYPTYNEYFCPRCRKQNHVRSPGAVVTVRVARTGRSTSTTVR